MELSFDDRAAIITGAGSALGRSHSLELARRGAKVVVNDFGRSVHGEGEAESAAQRVVDEITAFGGEAIANCPSVASPAGGQAIVEAALRAFGRVDILVNNAGILRDRAFHNMGAEDIDAVLDVHLRGAMFMTQPAFKFMRDNHSAASSTPRQRRVCRQLWVIHHHLSGEAGVFGLTWVLVDEGACVNSLANAIAPGAGTRMTTGLLGDLEARLGLPNHDKPSRREPGPGASAPLIARRCLFRGRGQSRPLIHGRIRGYRPSGPHNRGLQGQPGTDRGPGRLRRPRFARRGDVTWSVRPCGA